MRLKVLRKNECHFDTWDCVDEKGVQHCIDLTIDTEEGPAEMRAFLAQLPAVVEVDYLMPNVEIGARVRRVQQ
jgi:hypothetical protein